MTQQPTKTNPITTRFPRSMVSREDQVAALLDAPDGTDALLETLFNEVI